MIKIDLLDCWRPGKGAASAEKKVGKNREKKEKKGKSDFFGGAAGILGCWGFGGDLGRDEPRFLGSRFFISARSRRESLSSGAGAGSKK